MALRRFSLRIELLWSQPLVWRRIWVDDTATFGQLHHYLQAAMGWCSCHRYQFEIDGLTYRLPDEDDALAGSPIEDDRQWTLADLLKVGKPDVLYRYDLGDNWLHRIVIEGALLIDESPGHVLVAAGERACPPEDCGGVERYNQLVAQMTDAVPGPGLKTLRERIGEDFDPARFDRHAANAALQRMAWNGWDRLPGIGP